MHQKRYEYCLCAHAGVKRFYVKLSVNITNSASLFHCEPFALIDCRVDGDMGCVWFGGDFCLSEVIDFVTYTNALVFKD